MGPVIRRAEAKDVERLGELHSACWSELYPTVLSQAILADLDAGTMTGLWSKFISRGDGYIQWVAEVDNQVVGFVGIGPGRDPGYEGAIELYFIYVQPQSRRTGVGKRLLIQAAADYLWIHEANRESQTFYRKQKYFPDSVRRAGSLFGSELPEIRMSH
jgi:GNAT superfamily N-acetyltransferase